MKSISVLLLVLFFSVSAFADVGDRTIVVEKEKEEKAFSKCPKTLMAKDCLACHTIPTFALKEADPHMIYNYPSKLKFVFNAEKKPVAGYFIMDSIEADEVGNAFRYCEERGVKHLIFDVHSPGGSLFQSSKIVGMFDSYKERGFTIETRCYGFAASAAFYIFANGSVGYRLVSPMAEMMWHEIITFKLWAIESPADKEDEARVLRHLQDTTNTRLSQVSRLSKGKLDDMIRKKELWIRGVEAVEYGFADKLLGK